MRLSAIILVLAFGLLSCRRSVIECELSTDTEFQASEIRRAVARWNDVTRVTVAIVDRGEWILTTAPMPSTEGGLTQHSRHLVRIDQDLPDAYVYPVALHELGHVLDLRHTCLAAPPVAGPVASDRPCDQAHSLGVMDPTHHDAELTADDIRECKAAGSC